MELPLKTFSFPLTPPSDHQLNLKCSCVTDAGEIFYVLTSENVENGSCRAFLHSVDPITEERKSVEFPRDFGGEEICDFELIPFNSGRQVLICTTVDDLSHFQVANWSPRPNFTDFPLGGDPLEIPEIPKQNLTGGELVLVDVSGTIVVANLLSRHFRSLNVDFDHSDNKFVVGQRLFTFSLESFPKSFGVVDLTDPSKPAGIINAESNELGELPNSSKYLSSGVNMASMTDFWVLLAGQTVNETPTYWAPKVNISGPKRGILWELWRLDLSTFRWSRQFEFLSSQFDRLDSFHLAPDGRLTLLAGSFAQIFSLKVPPLSTLAQLAAQKPK